MKCFYEKISQNELFTEMVDFSHDTDTSWWWLVECVQSLVQNSDKAIVWLLECMVICLYYICIFMCVRIYNR